VAIARALVMEARVVVLDEPTSALDAEDTAHVLACIRELAAQGVAVVYVTHFLEEVSRVADTWTALRAGRAVASGSARGSSVDDLVRHFAGGGSPPRAAPREMDAGAVGLHVSGLSGRVSPRGIDLFVPRGEVLGLFGLAGSGRSACLRTILGADERASGSVRVGDGAELAQGARAGVRGGLGLLPEDRVASAFRNASVQDHVTIARLDPLSRFGVLDTTRLAQATRAALDAVRAPHVDPHGALDELSGGMQQRVLLARLVHQAPDVFLLDEPTRGVDVAARRDIHDLVRELAGRGHTLLIASSSEEELLTVCDTIAVMRRGRIVESRAASHWTRGDLLRIASSDGEAA
jgi:ribose transport system ATP-binding protein